MTANNIEIGTLNQLTNVVLDGDRKLNGIYDSDDAEVIATTILEAGWRPPPDVVHDAGELERLLPGLMLISRKTGHVWWRHPKRRRWEGTGGAYSLDLDFIHFEAPLVVVDVNP
jgi:hypothetical protein